MRERVAIVAYAFLAFIHRFLHVHNMKEFPEWFFVPKILSPFSNILFPPW